MKLTAAELAKWIDQSGHADHVKGCAHDAEAVVFLTNRIGEAGKTFEMADLIRCVETIRGK